jgi:hypothetical protein
MSKFTVTAPEAGHEGKVGNVEFRDGKAVIDEDTHAAELAYCRSAGYTVEAVEGDGETPAEDPPTGDGEAEGGKPFDPAEHNAADVLAYLKDVDEAEATRVLDAEAAGKERKGITDQREQILASKQKEGEDQ